jgi:hypothetical protein
MYQPCAIGLQLHHKGAGQLAAARASIQTIAGCLKCGGSYRKICGIRIAGYIGGASAVYCNGHAAILP